MAAKGYGFGDSNEAMQYCSDKLVEFSKSMSSAPKGPDGRRTLGPSQKAALRRLVDEEIAIATDDAACSKPHDEMRALAIAEYQERFLREHS